MSRKTTLIIYAALGILLLLVIVVGTVFIVNQRNESNEHINDLLNEGEKLNSSIDSLEKNKSELETAKGALEAELASLKNKLSELESKLSEAENKLENSGESYKKEINELKSIISLKNSAISSLEADIAKFSTVYTIDIREQAKLIDELVEYIETACPIRRLSTPVLNKDGEVTDEVELSWVSIAELEEELLADFERKLEQTQIVLDAQKEEKEPEGLDEDFVFDEKYVELLELDEEELLAYFEENIKETWREREDLSYPNVSVYYEDLATGYHLGFNETAVYDSASVIKAPFICSLLKLISADEKKYLKSLESKGEQPELIDTNGDGVPDTPKIEWSDPDYDLSKKVIYNKDTMFKEGSGKIKDLPSGTELTILDLIKYTLEYSDNIGYQQIRNRFDFSIMSNFAQSVGAKSVLRNGRQMTAEDAGKLFKAIWDFSEEDEKYGEILKTSMTKSNHTVIIPFGAYPNKVMHKYGWDTDAYHDAGIVLAQKPYVIAVFSDMDCGGEEVDEYLKNIVITINKLHNNFYKAINK